MNSIWDMVAVLSGRPSVVGTRFRKIGSSVMKAAPKKAAEDAAQATDDDHEQDIERPVEIERRRFDGAQEHEGQQRTGDAAIERADREREQLGAQRPDADDLGGDVHVADRHPGAAGVRSHQVLGDERQDRDDDTA